MGSRVSGPLLLRKDGTTFTLEVYVKQVVWRGTPAMMSVATDITGAWIDFVKETIAEVIQSALDNVAEVADFIIDLIAALNDQIADAEQKGQEIAGQLGEAESLGDIVSIVWDAVTEAIGAIEGEADPETLQEEAGEVTDGISETRSTFSE